MIFTQIEYLYFFVLVFCIYWTVQKKTFQNILLLISSYTFYGWVHFWFLYLIAASTTVDFLTALGIQKYPDKKKVFLIISICVNLILLGFFKYFNFFTENVHSILISFGFKVNPLILQIFLPVGISFYTFQSLSYIIDVYRGDLKARTNFIDFALYVSFFPQLVAGPIERATHLLPQLENKRVFKKEMFAIAFPLIIQGLLKKLVIADNIAIYADKVYMLEHPSFLMLVAGTLAFALQIYTDFSAYTDIARGSAVLLGVNLMENFKDPYLAISPSDFWRRWHISFSSWIRDYLYISLGGSRVKTKIKFLFVLLVTFGLSGLWHGASWHFVIWGLYHALLLFIYHQLGMGGRWQPTKIYTRLIAWILMFSFTIFGWMLFRTSNMTWLIEVFTHLKAPSFENIFVSFQIIIFVVLFSIPLVFFWFMENVIPNQKIVHSVIYGLALSAIILFVREKGLDFIYFQF